MKLFEMPSSLGPGYGPMDSVRLVAAVGGYVPPKTGETDGGDQILTVPGRTSLAILETRRGESIIPPQPTPKTLPTGVGTPGAVGGYGGQFFTPPNYESRTGSAGEYSPKPEREAPTVPKGGGGYTKSESAGVKTVGGHY